MTNVYRPYPVLRLAILPVLALIALFALLPNDGGASPGHDGSLHASHAMNHRPVATGDHHVSADCGGSAIFCALMGMCHPALSPGLLVLPVASTVNTPEAPDCADLAGRDPAIIIPPPRWLIL